MDLRNGERRDIDAVFAARGWLSENPAAFRSLVVGKGVPYEVRIGSHVFRRDDDATGLYGIISGAIGIEGGHRRQTPLLGHIFRTESGLASRRYTVAGAN